MKVDTIDKNWAWVTAQGAKSHACHKHLVSLVIGELHQVGYKVNEVEGLDEMWLDLPGMAMIDRQMETVSFEDLVLHIPSQDVEIFLYQARHPNIRKFPNGYEYSRIHGFERCIILTPPQSASFSKALELVYPIAKERAEQDKAEFDRRIQHINEERLQIVKPDMELLNAVRLKKDFN